MVASYARPDEDLWDYVSAGGGVGMRPDEDVWAYVSAGGGEAMLAQTRTSGTT